MKVSEVSDDGRISETNFLDRWRKYFIQEKRKKESLIYDWKLLRMESKDIRLKSFLNLIEKLINPSGRRPCGGSKFTN